MTSFNDLLLAKLPQVRAEFHALGFHLPRMYLRVVESLRPRQSAERDFQEYSDEVLREYMGLPYPWQIALRPQVAIASRSSYLDFLQALHANDESSSSLDPNYELFLRLEHDAWQKLLQEFRTEKARELRYLPARSTSGASLFADMAAHAESIGFRRARAWPGGKTASFERHSRTHGRCLVKIVDVKALQKRGDVLVQYFFEPLGDKPFGLNSFAVGGYLYSEWNETPDAAMFSFCAQLEFMSLLFKAIE